MYRLYLNVYFMFGFDRIYRYLFFAPTLSCCIMPLIRCLTLVRCVYSQIRSMRFVKEIDLLVVVEGTAILKIYSAGLHKVGQIEPAISVRKLMIDNNQRSKKTTAKKGKAQSGSGAAARAGGSGTAAKGQEVKPRVHNAWGLGTTICPTIVGLSNCRGDVRQYSMGYRYYCHVCML